MIAPVARWPLACLLAACASHAPAETDWMAKLPDTRGLAALSIPGTHDSAARFEPAAGTAKCQDLTIADQLAAGIRYFDLRCRHVQDAFLMYHGPIDQNASFDDVLQTMFAFLDAHPHEAVIVSVKEEAAPTEDTRSFEATFESYVAKAPDRWYLGAAPPTLGEARGKLVLLRRFDATNVPLGIDATQWPDNATFTISDADATIRVQDDYMVTANDAKWTAITGLFDEARTGPASTLFLDYTSGYQMMGGLPNIPSVSDDIDARLDTLLGSAAPGDRLGVVVGDFATEPRAASIIATNQP